MATGTRALGKLPLKLKARGKFIFNICRLNGWRIFCKGFEMASPGAVYHPEEIELMTAALDDAVRLANGQRSSAVKVRFARRILASAAEGERDPVELRISAFLGAADDDG
jgi:hypothetical protein